MNKTGLKSSYLLLTWIARLFQCEELSLQQDPKAPAQLFQSMCRFK